MRINVRAIHEALAMLQAAAPDCSVNVILGTENAGDIADCQAEGYTVTGCVGTPPRDHVRIDDDVCLIGPRRAVA